jgi:acyl-coenzyme A thioesterase PaaI-like protein
MLGSLGIMLLKRDLSLLLGTSSAWEKGFLRVFSTIRGIVAVPLPVKHLREPPGSDLTALTLQPKAFSVDDLTNTAFLRRPDLHVETQGEFAGWRTWSRDSFESNNGPFWHKMDDDGRVRCAFRVEQKHLNGQRNVHGGAFMTFADYCLFAFASPVLKGPGVTVSFACEFLDAAHEGDLIEATGEITRAGGSLIFLRGMLTCGERKLFAFSGTIKRVKRKMDAS